MYEKNYSYSHIVNTASRLSTYEVQGQEMKLGRPRKPKRIVQDVLSESEISRLIQATRNAREKAIICLLAYSGIRNSELCGLRRKDVESRRQSAQILGGKNKKDRVANISAECTKALIEYLSVSTEGRTISCSRRSRGIARCG